MFDIGFTEIVVIAVVALIVIGPERLPKTARTLGHLFGRLQRYVNDVKADINREMELDELRKLQRRCRPRRPTSSRRSSPRRSEVETGVRDVDASLNAAAAGQRPTRARRRDARACMEPAPLPQRAAAGAARRCRARGAAAASRRCRASSVI